MHEIQYAYSASKHFDNQSDMAKYLGIKNSSKNAIKARCRVFGYGVRFNGEYDFSVEYQG